MVLALLPLALLLAVNAGLSFVYAMPPAVDDWNLFRRERAQTLGENLDWRTGAEVLAACRSTGCRPYVNATELPMAGSILPVAGGMPRSRTVYCNETGKWKFVDTDRFGFDSNADRLFENADVVLVGDSFATGACVEEERTIAGLLRSRGIELLNLGVGGNKPLEQLAVIKEYMPSAHALVLTFYEGNNYLRDRNPEFMKKYLDPGFTQHLKQRPDEVAENIARIEEIIWSHLDAWFAPGQESWQNHVRNALAPTISLLRSFDPAGLEFDQPLYQQTLAEAYRTASEKGARRFYLVYLPAAERFMWAPRNHPEVAAFDKLKESVKASAGATGFVFIDMTDRFYRTPDPLGLIPYRSHAHYNQAGYLLVADALESALRAAPAPSSLSRQ